MTISDALTRLDLIKQNAYTQQEKVAWLSRLDSMVRKSVIDTHEGGPEEPFAGYTDLTPLTTELLAGEPWDEMYLHYLEAQIDYANGETARYNNAISLFNTVFSDYANAYNRTHAPKGQQVRYF